jgi:hypothetical protein
MATQASEIRGFILARIRKGRLGPGDKLPSRPEIEKRFGCARATVDRAFAGLKRDGIIRSEFGKGTFVAEHKRGRSAGRSPVVVLPSVTPELQKSLFVFGIYRPLVRELAGRGRDAHSIVGEPRAPKGHEWEALSRARIVYWVRPGHESVRVMEELRAARVPQVLLNRDYGEFPCVLTDAVEGQRRAVAHLRELGHQRIGYLHWPPNPLDAFTQERLVGFLDGVHRSGLAPDAAPRLAVATHKGTEKQVSAWLTSESPTALILQAGLVGTLMRATAMARLRIPRDLSVLTVDEVHDPSGLLGYTFTCQRQRLEELGRRAAHLDPEDLERGGKAVKVRLAPRLLEGNTTVRRTQRRSARTRSS